MESVFALGFDISQEDPQSQVAVSSEGFHRLDQTVADLDLPTVVVQEGGYHLHTLGLNTLQFLSGLRHRAAL